MVMENELALLQCIFGQSCFLNKKLGKFKKILGFRCQFNQISYILAKFHKYFNTKKMEDFHLQQNILLQMNIDFIPLFDVYDLLSTHFVSSHGHTTLAIHQNISKE